MVLLKLLLGVPRFVSSYYTAREDPESFVRRGSTFGVFLVNEGMGDPNTTISGPLSARQRSAI